MTVYGRLSISGIWLSICFAHFHCLQLCGCVWQEGRRKAAGSCWEARERASINQR